MITPHELSKENPTEELALGLVGELKSGKSWLAGTAPGTILFLDFDRRAGALRSHPNAKNIFALTFTDPSDTKTMPTAISETISIMNKIEQCPKLSNIHDSFKGNDRIIDTLVYDSVQTMSDAARNYILYNSGKDDGISKNYTVGDQVVRVPKSYTAWGAETEMVKSIILQGRSFLHCKKCWHSVTSWIDPQGFYKTVHTDELISAKNPQAKKYDHPPEPKAMNIIMTLHERPEEDPRSTDDAPMYTGKIIVSPPRYRVLLVFANEVWRLTRPYGRTQPSHAIQMVSLFKLPLR